MYPMMSRRRGAGRLLWPLFWLMLLIYVIKNPVEAAADARGLIVWLRASTEAIVGFLEQVGHTR